MTTQSTSTGHRDHARPPSGHQDPQSFVAAFTARLTDEGLSADGVALVGAFAVFGPAYQRWASTLARPGGLSVARLQLLWALRVGGSQQMSDIRSRLGVTARNVTQLVDGLEADGMVRRIPHPSDRRATIVELTDLASSVLDDSFSDHTRSLAMLFDRLPADDRAALLRIIGDLTAVLGDVGGDVACVPDGH